MPWLKEKVNMKEKAKSEDDMLEEGLYKEESDDENFKKEAIKKEESSQ